MKTIVMGTQSRYKLGLFDKLNLPYESASPPYEEVILPGLDPIELAKVLSEGKAKSLAPLYTDHTIISGDQVLALGCRVFTKPGSVDKAVEQLLELAGQTHALHTAFSVLDSGSGAIETQVVSSYITFYDNFNPDYLRDLVVRDETTDCVGSYKFESSGLLLMDKVDTPDPNAIIGLPLMALSKVLAERGYFAGRFRFKI